ncbi:unnamed protein product [Sphagnum jensenii]|uniref:Secreted protein n=1 Tax=Sphagnum jensenii TaxID=128206 RepID=A0ABP1A8H7_9BRYO
MGLKTCASLLCFASLCTTCLPLRAIVVAVPPSLACLLHLLTQLLTQQFTFVQGAFMYNVMSATFLVLNM